MWVFLREFISVKWIFKSNKLQNAKINKRPIHSFLLFQKKSSHKNVLCSFVLMMLQLNDDESVNWLRPLKLIANYIFNLVKIYYQNQPKEPWYQGHLRIFRGRGSRGHLKAITCLRHAVRGTTAPRMVTKFKILKWIKF